MDSFKKILFTSLVALSSSVHANTAPLDLYVNWTGAYVGAYFGAGSGNADTKFHANGLSAVNQIVFSSTETQIGTISQAGRLHGNVTGSIADLFAGFNYHFACTPWLLGAQVEGSFFSDITDKTVGTENENTATAVISFTPPFVTSNTTRTTASATANVYDELTSMFKLVGRVGYIIDPSTMIYILGGGVAGN